MNHGKVGKTGAQDQCQLFYRSYPHPGNPRIVLIHSLALDSSVWNAVVQDLARDFEILTYDCRGHGQSDGGPSPYTIRLFADDLAAILDRCKWPAAIIAGCSMGGCTAQAFAASTISRTRRSHAS